MFVLFSQVSCTARGIFLLKDIQKVAAMAGQHVGETEMAQILSSTCPFSSSPGERLLVGSRMFVSVSWPDEVCFVCMFCDRCGSER